MTKNQRQSKKKFRAFMCGVAWQHELGETDVRIFPSEESCAKKERCTKECGIVEVEVEVKLKRWARKQDLSSKRVLGPGSQVEPCKLLEIKPFRSDDRCWTSFDVFKAILAMTKEDCKTECITADDSVIQAIVHHLSQDSRFGTYFKGFSFKDTGDQMWSPELDSQLASLQMAGHLSCEAPFLEKYRILDKSVRNYELYVKRLFSTKELSDILEMAKVFAERTGR